MHKAVVFESYYMDGEDATVDGQPADHTLMFLNIRFPDGSEKLMTGDLLLWHDAEGVKKESGVMGMTGWNRKFSVEPQLYVEGDPHIMVQLFKQVCGMPLVDGIDR